MRGAEQIDIDLPVRTAGIHKKDSPGKSPGSTGTDSAILDHHLYGLLVGLRAKMAAQSGRPAFTVFTNSVLVELANNKPQTEEAALAIKGIGPNKVKSILPEFLKAIKDCN